MNQNPHPPPPITPTGQLEFTADDEFGEEHNFAQDVTAEQLHAIHHILGIAPPGGNAE